MDKKILKAKDIAQLWGITPRRVNQLCTAGFINGAYKEGRYWLIPSDTTKPEILRNKQTPPLSGRLLPCPVGITSYKEVSKECYYVDKTLLIKDIIGCFFKIGSDHVHGKCFHKTAPFWENTYHGHDPNLF